MQMPKTYGLVPLKQVEAALQQLKDQYKNDPTELEKLEITFEYLVGSFFPKIIDNINSRMNDTYTQGYLQGLNDAKTSQN